MNHLKYALPFILIPSFLVGCSEKEVVEKGDFVYSYDYTSFPETPQAVGLWNGGYLEEKVFDKMPYNIRPDYFVAGDELLFEVNGGFGPTLETYPCHYTLNEGSTITSFVFQSAIIEKIPRRHLKYSEGSLSYQGIEIEPYVITSHNGDFLPFHQFHGDVCYGTFQEVEGKREFYGLYSFDPSMRQISDNDVYVSAFGERVAPGEIIKVSANLYEPFTIRIIAGDKYQESDVAIECVSEYIQCLPKPVETSHELIYTCIPVSDRAYSLIVRVGKESFTFLLTVLPFSKHYRSDFALEDYPEIERLLSGIKPHKMLDPYPGLEASEDHRGPHELSGPFSADYSPIFKDYLFDDCFYPSSFPSAPKSPIMDRAYHLYGNPKDDHSKGAKASTIEEFEILLGEIDPCCTKPQDRVSYAEYRMLPKENALSYRGSITTGASALKHNVATPKVVTLGNIVFHLLEEDIGDGSPYKSFLGYFEAAKYFYSFKVVYYMERF